MARHDDSPENTIHRSRRFDADPPGIASRTEPGFSDFDDLHEDGYEEPDRDTNLASGYRADSVEDEEGYDDAFSEDGEREPFENGNVNASYDADDDLAEDSDTWIDEEVDFEGQEDDRQGWPLGLIMVGIVAIVLLAAGGYGVLQQRAATQEELRELRAALAVSASPDDVGSSRGALQTLQQSYDKLTADAQALTLENRRLADTVAGLEAQLGVQQSVPTKTSTAVQSKPDNSAPAASNAVAAASTEPTTSPAAEPRETAAQVTAPAPTPPPTTPTPAAVQPVVPTPAATQMATASASGPWFVNFGTYATRNMADTWASRVKPIAGEVIVAPNEKDGKTLYRVRVVGLSDRDSAQQVARKLETDLRVAQLWVGRE